MKTMYLSIVMLILVSCVVGCDPGWRYAMTRMDPRVQKRGKTLEYRGLKMKIRSFYFSRGGTVQVEISPGGRTGSIWPFYASVQSLYCPEMRRGPFDVVVQRYKSGTLLSEKVLKPGRPGKLNWIKVHNPVKLASNEKITLEFRFLGFAECRKGGEPMQRFNDFVFHYPLIKNEEPFRFTFKYIGK